jgi:diguanylate cyclase (GGDEF)-like protein
MGNNMTTTHPKLIESLVDQTPRAMIAMLIVSFAYFGILIKFIPFNILVIWFVFQILLAVYRLYNAKLFKVHLEAKNQEKIEKNERCFIISNVFQAFMWTMSSILSVIYAPQPYELIVFVMIIGIITAAALSMSALYKAYLIFFFSLIIPQIIILIYFGEHHHIGLVALTLIFIPAIILLSKALYNSRLSNIKAHDELEFNVNKFKRLSTIDALTNIYNRRCFFEMSNELIAIAIRRKQTVSLLMIDIDYFKKINDTYGHQIGDFILRDLVIKIEKNLRESDVFARVGGEEFAILLTDTSLDGAKIIAEKVRKIIDDEVFTYNSISVNLTISIGISELNKDNTTIEDLYKKADKQLYFAKKNGRNQYQF